MRPFLLLTAAAPLALLVSSPAAAETLQDAIAAAYASNPDIQAQRDIVAQNDEGISQARAPGRPSIGIQGQVAQAGLNNFIDNGRTYTVGIQLNQSLYRGGRVPAARSAAQARIYAARARLRAQENSVILNTVTAYADVLRFTRVVELNRNQISVLERELQASRDRFEVGDLTRTDVAQSEARVANAQSNLVLAENQLVAAREAFVRAVGHAPENLEPLPALPPLPDSEGKALEIANENNPQLIAARFDEQALRFDVLGLERQRLPSVDLNVQGSYQQFEGGGQGSSFVRQGQFYTQNASVVATIPIYQRGLVGSQIRQTQAQRSQAMAVIASTDRQVRQNIVNSIATLRAARATIKANEIAVSANTLAAEGVRQENQVGTRTIIEVLNAEQERLNAEVNLVTARRDEQVAGYSLLANAGGAEAVQLGVPVKEYDPEINARRVSNKFGDDGDESAPPLPMPDKARATKSLVIGPPAP
ncbi:hypothetical protein IP88_02465 [alpha proteobacterium AAP81b]|nr:hypothetical protein IP88_02465 [alpha proteobacterium AAP81b]